MRSIRGTIPTHLGQRAGHLRMLENSLRDCLPAECCQHARIAGFDGDALVVIARSTAWRTRLHLYSNRIIEHFAPLAKSPLKRVRQS